MTLGLLPGILFIILMLLAPVMLVYGIVKTIMYFEYRSSEQRKKL